ncbi:MAG: NBR1-Ig-like domain-containing protein [Pelolinea sp.]|nr:NBR1-Ig-like domain-containing protein [Pelolinea sp.]
MKISKYLLISIVLGISLVVAACGPKVEPTPTVDPNAIMTQVAMTVQAEVTQMALLTPSPTTTLPPTATLTPVPIQTLPAAPKTPVSQPTLPFASPDNATWIADVTVPDDKDDKVVTVFWKNETFTKTWKIENTGTTTWDTTYKLVYLDGPVLGETLIVSITSPVKPKNQIEISVPMKAPATLGTVINYWRMMNGKGQFFGDVLYVKFVVGTELEKTVTPNPG